MCGSVGGSTLEAHFMRAKERERRGRPFASVCQNSSNPNLHFQTFLREREREREREVQCSAGVIPNDVVMTAFTTNKSNLKIRNQD